MQALSVKVIQLMRADPDSVKRDSLPISLMIATHEDSDAFVLALAYAARNMSDEALEALDSCITRVALYEHFCVRTHLQPIRARANFRAG